MLFGLRYYYTQRVYGGVRLREFYLRPRKTAYCDQVYRLYPFSDMINVIVLPGPVTSMCAPLSTRLVPLAMRLEPTAIGALNCASSMVLREYGPSNCG